MSDGMVPARPRISLNKRKLKKILKEIFEMYLVGDSDDMIAEVLRQRLLKEK